MTVRAGLSFVLLMIFLSFSARNVSSLTHDQKVDMISEAYMSLKHVAQTLLDVHTTIEDGASNTESDLSTLKDSKTRSEYEVFVMDTEHRQMLAEAAKRSVTPEEEEDATRRGEAIEVAQQKVDELGTEITKTQTKVNELNSQMTTLTLSPTELKKLQDKANLEAETPDDHITMPSTDDIKNKVDEQLANIQTVIDTITDTTVQEEARELKNNIATKFTSVLNDESGLSVAELTTDLKKIDIDLLHLRNLDIYGSAAKMEL